MSEIIRPMIMSLLAREFRALSKETDNLRGLFKHSLGSNHILKWVKESTDTINEHVFVIETLMNTMTTPESVEFYKLKNECGGFPQIFGLEMPMEPLTIEQIRPEINMKDWERLDDNISIELPLVKPIMKNEDVTKLMERTGVEESECVIALTYSKGDQDIAYAYLRSTGHKIKERADDKEENSEDSSTGTGPSSCT